MHTLSESHSPSTKPGQLHTVKTVVKRYTFAWRRVKEANGSGVTCPWS